MNRREVYAMVRSLTGQGNVLGIPRPFIRLTGGYEPAALLSQIIYWTDYAKADGWFYKEQTDWQAELEMSEYLVRASTAKLVKMGLVETKLQKVAGRPLVHYRVNMDAVIEAVAKLAQEPVSEKKKARKPDSEKFSESKVETPDSEKITESDSENLSESMDSEKISESFLQETTQETTKQENTREGLAAQPPLLTSAIELWPQGLSWNHVRALIGAGYTPATVRQASPDDLLKIKGIGWTAVTAITGQEQPQKETAPAEVELVREATGKYPPRISWDLICNLIPATAQADDLKDAYAAWVAAGRNPMNYAGWLEWYSRGGHKTQFAGGAYANGYQNARNGNGRPGGSQGAGNPRSDGQAGPTVDELNRRLAEARAKLAAA